MNQVQLRLIRDVNADIKALEKQAALKRRRLEGDERASLGLGIFLVLLVGGLLAFVLSVVP